VAVSRILPDDIFLLSIHNVSGIISGRIKKKAGEKKYLYPADNRSNITRHSRGYPLKSGKEIVQSLSFMFL